MSQIEQEISKTLDTANRIGVVAPSEELIHRLKQIPSAVKQGYQTIPKRIVWAAAASIAILIALNVLSAKNFSGAKSASETNQTSEYFYYLNSL